MSGRPAPVRHRRRRAWPALARPGSAGPSGPCRCSACIRERSRPSSPLAGLTVAACLHVTAETAVLVNVLRAGGRAGLPGRLQPAVHPGRRRRGAGRLRRGVTCSPGPGRTGETYYEHIHRALDAAPGPGHRRRRRPGQHAARAAARPARRGARRLRVHHHRGDPAAPDGRGGHAGLPRGGGRRARPPGACSTTRYGTGQSAHRRRSCGPPTPCWPGRTVVVAGLRARAARASPSGPAGSAPRSSSPRSTRSGRWTRSWQGFRVLPMADAAPLGEVFITATGSRDVITAGAPGGHAGRRDPGQRRPLRRGDRRARRWQGWPSRSTRDVRPHTDEYVLADGRRLMLLAEGRVVNLVAGGGQPGRGDGRVVRRAGAGPRPGWPAARPPLPPGVHEVPARDRRPDRRG